MHSSFLPGRIQFRQTEQARSPSRASAFERRRVALARETPNLYNAARPGRSLFSFRAALVKVSANGAARGTVEADNRRRVRDKPIDANENPFPRRWPTRIRRKPVRFFTVPRVAWTSRVTFRENVRSRRTVSAFERLAANRFAIGKLSE